VRALAVTERHADFLDVWLVDRADADLTPASPAQPV
jgi:hypothetical protein